MISIYIIVHATSSIVSLVHFNLLIKVLWTMKERPLMCIYVYVITYVLQAEGFTFVCVVDSTRTIHHFKWRCLDTISKIPPKYSLTTEEQQMPHFTGIPILTNRDPRLGPSTMCNVLDSNDQLVEMNGTRSHQFASSGGAMMS